MLIPVFEINIVVTNKTDFNLTFAAVETEFWLSMSVAPYLEATAFQLEARQLLGLVLHLFSEKSEVFSYQLICFTKHGVECLSLPCLRRMLWCHEPCYN